MRLPEFSFFAPCAGLALLVLGFAGCTTEINYSTATADGQRVTFRMLNGVPDHGNEDGIQTDTPKIEPNFTDHKLRYVVRLFDRSGQPGLRSVRVEDVTEGKPMLLIEDNTPQLKNQEWRGTSPFFEAEDEPLKWIGYLDQTFCVYRFTIVRADGRTIVLHEGMMVSPYSKTMLRHALGEKY